MPDPGLTERYAASSFPLTQVPKCECGAECTVSNGQWVCPECGLVHEPLMVPSISSYRSSAIMRRHTPIPTPAPVFAPYRASRKGPVVGSDNGKGMGTNMNTDTGTDTDMRMAASMDIADVNASACVGIGGGTSATDAQDAASGFGAGAIIDAAADLSAVGADFDAADTGADAGEGVEVGVVVGTGAGCGEDAAVIADAISPDAGEAAPSSPSSPSISPTATATATAGAPDRASAARIAGRRSNADPSKAKLFFRLAHNICRAASLVDAVASDAAVLALSKPMTCKDNTLHILAAVMCVSARMGGVHARLPEEWEDTIRTLNLRRPGRVAQGVEGGHRTIRMWSLVQYAKETYGSLPPVNYWGRILSLLPMKAARRASILLEAPRNASQAGGAILLADYDSKVTDEHLKRLKIKPELARVAMRSISASMGGGDEARKRGIDMTPFIALYRLCDLLDMPWQIEAEVARKIRQNQLEGRRVGTLAAAALLYAASTYPPQAVAGGAPAGEGTGTGAGTGAGAGIGAGIGAGAGDWAGTDTDGTDTARDRVRMMPRLMLGRRMHPQMLVPGAQLEPQPRLRPQPQPQPQSRCEAFRLPGEWSKALKAAGYRMDIPEILYNVRRHQSALIQSAFGSVRQGNSDRTKWINSYADRFIYRVGTIVGIPKPRLKTLIAFTRLSAKPPVADLRLTALAAISALGLADLGDKETRARLEKAGIYIGHRGKKCIRMRKIEEERKRLLEAWGRAAGRAPLAGVLSECFEY